METELSKVVGTFKYGKLLSKPALAVQWAIVGLSVVFSALLGSALAVARGDMATVVGWIVWGLWLLAVLGIFAELIADLFNRRLIARCLKIGDLRQGEAIGFSHPSPFFGAKAAIKTAFPDGVKTFRTRDRVLLREMEAGRAVLFRRARRRVGRHKVRGNRAIIGRIRAFLWPLFDFGPTRAKQKLMNLRENRLPFSEKNAIMRIQSELHEWVRKSGYWAYALFFEVKMENCKQNKMAITPMRKLVWKMGLPMIVSMILQSVYNIVDTAFVINMGEDGIAGNLALTYAFPIQLLMIAIGVGTGVGVNALLSKQLGEKDVTGLQKTVGNGIFIGVCIYVVFLLFGLFGCNWFISMQAGGNEKAAEMGGNYLKICCLLSFGSIGFTIYERFLQATGKTLFSTIAQISGAAANILLDYVFIYPCGMGIEGAAWATVAGQILSLIAAMLLHYCANKEIKNSVKALIPDGRIILAIYKIGISAALMQGLLSVMTLGMTKILGTVKEAETAELLQGSFGIYYKIMQFALFAAFGLSNTIISVLSFNYGMKEKERVKECIKYGVLDSAIVALVITVLFESLAVPLAKLFAMTGGAGGDEIQAVVVNAVRIASIGYVFMAVSVAVQGVLQAFRYALFPLLISFLRLCLLVLPIAYCFTLSSDVLSLVWWTFPIVEVVTAAISVALLKAVCRKKVSSMN